MVDFDWLNPQEASELTGGTVEGTPAVDLLSDYFFAMATGAELPVSGINPVPPLVSTLFAHSVNVVANR